MTADQAAAVLWITRDAMYQRIRRNKKWQIVDESGHWDFERIIPLMPKGRQKPGVKVSIESNVKANQAQIE